MCVNVYECEIISLSLLALLAWSHWSILRGDQAGRWA